MIFALLCLLYFIQHGFVFAIEMINNDYILATEDKLKSDDIRRGVAYARRWRQGLGLVAQRRTKTNGGDTVTPLRGIK